MEDHIKHVTEFLRRLDTNGYCISKENMELGEYWSKIDWVTQYPQKGVYPDTDKVMEVLSMKKIWEHKRTQISTGNVDVLYFIYSAYSHHCSTINQSTEEEQHDAHLVRRMWEAWNDIKNKLSSAPIMGLYWLLYYCIYTRTLVNVVLRSYSIRKWSTATP